jgi:hypothetical protein
MNEIMRKRAIDFGKRLDELESLGGRLLNLRSERARYVTGVYKIASNGQVDNLAMIVAGIDRETMEIVEQIARLSGNPGLSG